MSDRQVMSVKARPKDERPETRFALKGAASFSAAWLRPNSFRSSCVGHTTARPGIDLLEKFGNFVNSNLGGTTTLCAVKGGVPTIAVDDNAVVDLDRRCQKPDLTGESYHPRDAAFYYCPGTENYRRKMFRRVLLDTKIKIIRYEIIFIGQTTSAFRVQGSLPSCYVGIFGCSHHHSQSIKRRHQADPRGYFAEAALCKNRGNNRYPDS